MNYCQYCGCKTPIGVMGHSCVEGAQAMASRASLLNQFNKAMQDVRDNTPGSGMRMATPAEVDAAMTTTPNDKPMRDLDEAARHYCANSHDFPTGYRGFKAGAEWRLRWVLEVLMEYYTSCCDAGPNAADFIEKKAKGEK